MVAQYAILNLQQYKDKNLIIPWRFYNTYDKALQAYKGQIKWGNTEARLVELYQPGIEHSRYATPTTREDFEYARKLWEENPLVAERVAGYFYRAKSNHYNDRRHGHHWRAGAKKMYHMAIESASMKTGLSKILVEAIVKSQPSLHDGTNLGDY